MKITDYNQKDKYRQLGLNISYYRKLRGYTQYQLAEMIDVERTHIGRLETAGVGVSVDVIFRIADALKVPVSKLFEIRE